MILTNITNNLYIQKNFNLGEYEPLDIEGIENQENQNPQVSRQLFGNAEKTNSLVQKKRPAINDLPNPNKKIKRQIKPNSCGPNIIETEENKLEVKSDPQTIKEHAHMRMQLFALAVVGLYGLAIRSDGSEDNEFKFNLISAYLQCGKAINGKRKFKNKYQAAHYNAAAGYIDNSRERDIQTIFKEKDITPLKKQRLAAKGFTEEDFKLIKQNFDNYDELINIFDRIWTVNPLRPQSIFTGTHTDLVLNSTTEVERGINLVVDKWIELLRDDIKSIYEKIIFKEITPQEACIEYLDLNIKHLFRFEDLLKENSINLSKYEEEFNKLDNYININNFDSDKINELNNILLSLKKIETELNPAKIKKVKPHNISDNKKRTAVKIKIKNVKNPQDKISRVKLPKNKKFINASLYGLQQETENPVNRFKVWMLKKYDLLKNEFQTQAEKIKSYIQYSQMEREGTLLADFPALFGEMNSETGQLEVTEQSLAQAQQRTWTPINL